MKKYLKFLCLAVFLGSFLALPQFTPEALARTPDFTLRDLENTSYRLSSYAGRSPVILMFWTTWCPYCRTQMEELKKIERELQDSGCQLFTINVEEPAFKADNFMNSRGLTFKVLLDKDARVAASFGVMGVPTYVLINKEGEVVFKDNYFPKDTFRDLVR